MEATEHLARLVIGMAFIMALAGIAVVGFKAQAFQAFLDKLRRR